MFKAAPKCIRCEKSAYANESTTYDGATFHKTCFKCMNCKRSLQPSSVAKIEGDIYCKNCFKRMFRERGTYEVFGTSPAVSPRGKAASSASSSSAAAPASPRSAASSSAEPAAAAADAAEPAAEAKPAPAAAAAAAAAPAKEPAAAPRSRAASRTVDPYSDALAAVRLSSADRARDVAARHGAATFLEQRNGKTPVEEAFANGGSVEVGRAMLDCLADRLKALEAGVGGGVTVSAPAEDDE